MTQFDNTPPNGAHNDAPPTNGAMAFGAERAVAVAPHSPMAQAMVARAVAQQQARYIVAMQRPRDWMTVRQDLLKLCQIPEFAEAAWWSRKVGGEKIAGLTIRFAEEAQRAMGNLETSADPTYEDDGQLHIVVTVHDLESNHSRSKNLVIPKEVERSRSQNRHVLRKRKNYKGDDVFIVRATTEEMRSVISTAVSKTERTLTLAMLRADIRYECIAAVIETLKKIDARDASDPEQYRKVILDRFLSLGVTTAHVADWLGHGVDKATRAEMGELRDIAKRMIASEGALTWDDVLTERERALAEEKKERTRRERVQVGAKEAGARVKAEMEAERRGEPKPETPEPSTAKRADILRAAKPLNMSLEDVEAHLSPCFDGRNTKDLTPAECAEAIGLLACVEGVADRGRAEKIAAVLPDNQKPLAFAVLGHEVN